MAIPGISGKHKNPGGIPPASGPDSDGRMPSSMSAKAKRLGKHRAFGEGAGRVRGNAPPNTVVSATHEYADPTGENKHRY